jgi:GTP cyclohydrolase II
VHFVTNEPYSAHPWKASRKAFWPDVMTAKPFRISSITQVERAISDFRRALPVVISEPEASPIVALAAELAEPAVLQAVTDSAGEQAYLALTHNRAASLKIRLYTPEVVLLPQKGKGGWETAENARDLADPSRDLELPLRGPFQSLRTLQGNAWAAGIKLAKLAHLLPAVIAARLPATAPADEFARDHHLLCVSAPEILDYDVAAASELAQVTGARVPLHGAEQARLIAFRAKDGGPEHFALVIGDPDRHQPVLVRLHSECFTGDLLGSMKCDCGEQLQGAIKQINEAGGGVLLYLAQEGRGIGLINKLRAYRLQDQGFDTNQANERLGFSVDERIFLPAARMLQLLGVSQVRLMSNNPGKVAGLETQDIKVVERVPHHFPSNEHNWFYLNTKRDKSGHLL